MTQDQIRTLTALRRVQAFMHAAVENPLLANTTVARRRLDRVVAELTAHVVLAARVAHSQGRRRSAHFVRGVECVASALAISLTSARRPEPHWHADRRVHRCDSRGRADSIGPYVGGAMVSFATPPVISTLRLSPEQLCPDLLLHHPDSSHRQGRYIPTRAQRVRDDKAGQYLTADHE